MRVNLRKFLFVGPTKGKEAFFKKAQDFGVIDFIEKLRKGLQPSSQVLDVIRAIKVLRALPPREQLEDVDPAKAPVVVSEIIRLENEIEVLGAQVQLLRSEILEVEPLGYFSLEKIAKIERDGKSVVQFFSARKSIPSEKLPKEGFIWVGEDEELYYYMSVQKQRVAYPKMVEVFVKRPLIDLQNELQEKLAKIEALEQELKEYYAYKDFLYQVLLNQLNEDSLVHAKGATDQQFDGKMFVVTGWIPTKDVEGLKSLCKANNVFFSEVKIEPDDVVPTCLKNKGMSRVGEDLVEVYDTPSATDDDPSLWVMGFFTLFFSIIIGDACYGLIFLAIAGLLWYKFPGLKGAKRRFLVLMTTLSVGCIVWGVLSNAYFGIELSLDNPLRKVSLVNYLVEKKAEYHYHMQDNVFKEWAEKYPHLEKTESPYDFMVGGAKEKDGKQIYEVMNRFADNVMLELALLIGTIHIALSMARYVPRNWALVGWIVFVLGAYLFIPYHLNYTSIAHFGFGVDKEWGGIVGRDMLIVGVGLAVVLAIIQHRLMGTLEIATVIQIVGDVLSYLRLYALGLASGIMAATINEMAAGVPIVAGAIILFIGHSFNMVLAIMGGVIHGLRLNFLEWYHYSFEGGGRKYKPLRIQTKDE